MRVVWLLSIISVHVLQILATAVPRTLLSTTCIRIASEISSASDVYYPGHVKYARGINHWAASSTQLSDCVVEAGTAADVAVILNILGDTRTPFAVKGGGHGTNPGWSSTTGVHISLYRFSQVNYNAATQTAEVGAGLIWDDVYAALEPYNVNVVGGRVPGVGVAGFALGGGYSWKTNQFGLTADTVTAFELVTPLGAVLTVTQSSDPELFFGLKGGQNNFGIVTKFTLKTFPQTQVWGGIITILEAFFNDVRDATVNFHTNVLDPKASILSTFDAALAVPIVTLHLFYDGPTPPAGMFDEFMAITYLSRDVKTRSFLSLIQSAPAQLTSGQRAIFQTVPYLDVTTDLINTVINETKFWSLHLTVPTGTFISYAIEPFLPTLYTHNTETTAYPASRTQGYMPLNIYYAWLGSLSDPLFHNAAKASAKVIRDSAVSQGQAIASDAPMYPNYAIYDTPLEKLYGGNLPRLRALKGLVDPQNVMGLAGGFKL
ncbi:FAD-binding domain-containing protein [Panaeolus papilionaceus]|nr:FAD-binding domain-containing protein [Panaeolus papilionaceus]